MTTKHQFLFACNNWDSRTNTVIEANVPAHAPLKMKRCVVGGTFEAAKNQQLAPMVDFENVRLLDSRSVAAKMFVQTAYPANW